MCPDVLSSDQKVAAPSHLVFMNESADMRRPRPLVDDQLSSLVRNNVLTNVDTSVNKSQQFTKVCAH